MFEHTLVGTGDESRRPWSLAVSLLAQCLLLSLGVLIPLIYTQTLPAGQWVTQLLAPPPLAAPRAPTPKAAAAARQRAAPDRVDDSVLRQPRRIPREVALLDDSTRSAPVISELEAPLFMGGGARGVWGAFGTDGSAAAGVPPPPPEPLKPADAPVSHAPVPVGGVVQSAKLISQTMPQYPPLARQARVEGLVRLEAIIGEDGTIRKLRVVSGHPLLVPAALAAVTQWRYRPTLLNGQPVPVITQVEVRFTLSG